VPNIKITVAEKIATNTTPGEVIVCGNSDYTVTFDLDAEWAAEPNRTARFVYYKDGLRLYQDKPFTGTTVDVPKLSNINYVEVGVYAGDLRTTTPARVLCDRSILCGDPVEQITPEEKASLEARMAAYENTYVFSSVFRNALKSLLGAAVYTSDQSANIALLKAIMDNAKIYSVTAELTSVTCDNTVPGIPENGVYSTHLSAIDGYFLDVVTVTMGGVDITATAYDGNGNIEITAVTGDIVIMASAVLIRNMVEDIELELLTAMEDNMFAVKCNIGEAWANRAALIPIAQYMKKGKTYRCSLGGAAGHRYGVQIWVAPSADMVFEYAEGAVTYYDAVTTRLVDTGWMDADYAYTPTVDNCFITVNFKNSENSTLTETDRETLLANFTLEEVR
jgi:hypothetical protein